MRPPKDIPRFTVILDEDLFDKVEDYRFTHRCQTRKEAVLALLQIGLNVIEAEEAEKDKANAKKR